MINTYNVLKFLKDFPQFNYELQDEMDNHNFLFLLNKPSAPYSLS